MNRASTLTLQAYGSAWTLDTGHNGHALTRFMNILCGRRRGDLRVRHHTAERRSAVRSCAKLNSGGRDLS